MEPKTGTHICGIIPHITVGNQWLDLLPAFSSLAFFNVQGMLGTAVSCAIFLQKGVLTFRAWVPVILRNIFGKRGLTFLFRRPHMPEGPPQQHVVDNLESSTQP